MDEVLLILKQYLNSPIPNQLQDAIKQAIQEIEAQRAKRSRKIYNPEEFKAIFKVDDIIEGYSTNSLFKITAIGDRRFLAKRTDSNEEVAKTQCDASAAWRKPK